MIIDIEDKNLEKFIEINGINNQFAINVDEIKKFLVSFYNYMAINGRFDSMNKSLLINEQSNLLIEKEHKLTISIKQIEDEFKTNLDNNFKNPEV